MRTFLLLSLLLSIGQVGEACTSVEDCANKASSANSYNGVNAYGTLAIAYALEDVARAIHEMNKERT